MNIADHRFLSCIDCKNVRSLFRRIYFFLTGLVVWTFSCATAQQLSPATLRGLQEYFADAFQVDQHLINGTRYYNLYPAAPGNPFFEPDEFRTGSVIINDKEYRNVRLKYDICNQRLLLRHSIGNSGSSDIVLIDDAIREFAFDGKVFRKYTFPKQGEKYCQEIGTGSLRCLYFWHKELVPLNNSLDSYNQYTNPEKNCYLIRNGERFPFKGEKSFIRCFPLTQQHAIKKYIKENRIILRHAADADMLKLIVFCQTLEAEPTANMQANP